MSPPRLRLFRVGTCQIDLHDEAHSGCGISVARELRNVIGEVINLKPPVDEHIGVGVFIIVFIN